MLMFKMMVTELWARVANPKNFASENEIESAIVHLKNSNDRVLADMGLVRDEIENAVRHGRAKNDIEYDRRVA